MKYLASRFEKGKQWTEQFMTSKHRYTCLNGGLRDAHATLMSYDNFDNEEGAPHNPNPCLSLMLGILAHIFSWQIVDLLHPPKGIDQQWVNWRNRNWGSVAPVRKFHVGFSSSFAPWRHFLLIVDISLWPSRGFGSRAAEFTCCLWTVDVRWFVARSIVALFIMLCNDLEIYYWSDTAAMFLRWRPCWWSVRCCEVHLEFQLERGSLRNAPANSHVHWFRDYCHSPQVNGGQDHGETWVWILAWM